MKTYIVFSIVYGTMTSSESNKYGPYLMRMPSSRAAAKTVIRNLLKRKKLQKGMAYSGAVVITPISEDWLRGSEKSVYMKTRIKDRLRYSYYYDRKRKRMRIRED